MYGSVTNFNGDHLPVFLEYWDSTCPLTGRQLATASQLASILLYYWVVTFPYQESDIGPVDGIDWWRWKLSHTVEEERL
jgi:hypothetical protein